MKGSRSIAEQSSLWPAQLCSTTSSRCPQIADLATTTCIVACCKPQPRLQHSWQLACQLPQDPVSPTGTTPSAKHMQPWDVAAPDCRLLSRGVPGRKTSMTPALPGSLRNLRPEAMSTRTMAGRMRGCPPWLCLPHPVTTCMPTRAQLCCLCAAVSA